MGKYQTAGARFFASIIDGLIFLPFTYLISFFIVYTSANFTFWLQVLLQLVSVLYFILMHNYCGQTLGKMLLKVKVLDKSEVPISFLQAILRSLPTLLVVVLTVNFNNPQISDGTASSGDIWVAKNLLGLITGLLSLFSLVNAIFLLADKKNRALHDYIAGTVVVKTNI